TVVLPAQVASTPFEESERLASGTMMGGAPPAPVPNVPLAPVVVSMMPASVAPLAPPPEDPRSFPGIAVEPEIKRPNATRPTARRLAVAYISFTARHANTNAVARVSAIVVHNVKRVAISWNVEPAARARDSTYEPSIRYFASTPRRNVSIEVVPGT